LRLLLDTHVAIWAVSEPESLGARGLRLIEDNAGSIWVSTVSIWEIAIKYPLGRRFGAPPFSSAEAVRLFRTAGFELLDVTAEHAVSVETLVRLHADPFDRMLIAQAFSEPMNLLSGDTQVLAYGGTIVAL
jgi:PIN domain nuclease of toxin-antitoxin system